MENELSKIIIGAAIEVHRILGGPGLLESVYECALCHELTLRGLQIQRQLPIPVIYKSIRVKDPLYLDILVNNLVLIEVKATEKNNPLYETQTLTYIRLKGIKLGMLINFGQPQVKNGIIRIVNGL